MSYLIAFLLFAALPFAHAQSAQAQTVQSGQPSPAVSVDQENAHKAKALLDQMVQALGGQAYLNIQDMSQEGRTYSFHMGQPEGVGVVFWRFYRYPDQDRIELTKKRDVIYVYNGDKGYEITYKGTRADDPKTVADTLRRRQFALDQVVRHWLNEPGIALFYEGATVAAQKDTQKVTIMDADNQAVTLFIDSSTHLPVKKTYSWRDPTDRQRNIEDEVYDNYRQVQGIMTPCDVTRSYNGDMASQRFLTSVTYNKGLSDSLFAAQVSYDPNKPTPKK